MPWIKTCRLSRCVSKDGFPFNLDVSQIIHIPANEAPKVIARFGSMTNLVSQVLEPTNWQLLPQLRTGQ